MRTAFPTSGLSVGSRGATVGKAPGIQPAIWCWARGRAPTPRCLAPAMKKRFLITNKHRLRFKEDECEKSEIRKIEKWRKRLSPSETETFSRLVFVAAVFGPWRDRGAERVPENTHSTHRPLSVVNPLWTSIYQCQQPTQRSYSLWQCIWKEIGLRK